MDPMQHAALSRARTALDVAVANECSSAKAKAFVEIALGMMLNGKNFRAAIASHPSALVQKAVAESTFGEVWQTPNAAALAASYIGSIAEGSLLDQIITYGSLLPLNVPGVLVGSGYSANVTKEGDPKVVKNLELSTTDVELHKAAAIVVMTQELVRAIGGQAIFESEPPQERHARCQFLGAGPVAGQPAEVCRAERRRSGQPSCRPFRCWTIRGIRSRRAGGRRHGPGDAAGKSRRHGPARRHLHPRSSSRRHGRNLGHVRYPRFAHRCPRSGARVRSAGHATVNMVDTPTSPSQLVSLFQTNSIGLLAERNFHLAAASPMVVVGEDPNP